MRKTTTCLLAFAFFCLLGLQSQSAKAACNALFQYTLGQCPTIQFFDASTSTSGTVTQWNWTFGDGGTSTLQNPTHTYTANGVYTVCLMIITQFGCGSQYCVTLTINCINPNCQADFSVNTSGCPQILFTDTSTPVGGIASWSWTFGDGGTSTSQNPAHTYLINGNYAVCLTITTPNQCTSTFCDTISITCNPTVSCQAAFQYTMPNCPTVSFFDGSASTAGAIVSWSWNFGDGGTSTLQNPSHTYTANGSYQVCLAIATANGCTNTFCDTVTISCIQPGQCQAIFQSTMPQCPTVMFFDGSASSAGPVTSWAWSFGDGTTSTLQNPSHTYAANGNYQVCLTIATSQNCTSTFCDSVTINCIQPPACQANFTVNLAGCPQILFTSTSTSTSGSIVSYSWTFGDGGTSTAQNPAHTYLVNGNYVVCLAIATANGCTSTYCDTISITCNQGQCQAAFIYTWTPNLLVNFTDQSISSSGAIVSWAWTFGDGGTSTLQHPSHVYTAPGSYVVCLTITTNSTLACTSTTCDTIQVGTNAVSGPAELGSFVAAPNPFERNFHVYYALTEQVPIELTLYDGLGRKVAVIDAGERAPGEHQVEFAAEHLAQGLYILRLSSPSGSMSIRLLHR